MGEMIQQWDINDIRQKISDRLANDETAVINKLYDVCMEVAVKAKNNHEYNNYSGVLESSVGFIILKNLNEVKQWFMMASSGTDPSEGLNLIKNLVYDQIIGKYKLPDKTVIPRTGLAGVVFVAAKYASTVEERNRKVLVDFTPSSQYVLTILKTIIK